MENAQIVIYAKIDDAGALEVETRFYDLQPLYDFGPLTLEKLVIDNFVKAVSFVVKSEIQEEYEDQITECISETPVNNR